jgi:glycosyltransferase domain-containing protein
MSCINPLDDLTIIIPTFNRNYYLSRLLCYLKKNSVKNIIIADSSEPEKHLINEKTTRSLFGDKVAYNWTQEKEYGSKSIEKTISALDKVETPYVTLCSDKDFPIIPGVRDCITFLDNHPDYHVVNGAFFEFQVHYPEKIMNWCRQSTKRQTISLEKPIERMENLLQHYHPYSLIYSIHRTETLHKTMLIVNNYTDDVRFGELLMGITPLSYGKYAHLDLNYWCRENNPLHSGSLIFPRFEDYWRDGTFFTKYNNFKKGMLTILPDNSPEEIDQIIDSAMEEHIKKHYPRILKGNLYKMAFIFFKKINHKYISDEQKITIKKYLMRLHLRSQDTLCLTEKSWLNNKDIPLELIRVQNHIIEMIDNDAYVNDRSLICEDI